MTPDTEKNINEAIDWLQQSGGAIQDFAVEQAPLYCREVVAWELYNGIALCVLAVILLIVMAACWKVALRWKGAERAKKESDLYYSASEAFVGPMIGGIVAAIAAFVILTHGAPMAIKAAVAPRLVIVEHLRGLKD